MSEGRGGAMKYKVINSDIYLNKKIIPEGSEVELTKEQTKGIEEFLTPLTEQSHSALDAESITTKKNSKRSKQ